MNSKPTLEYIFFKTSGGNEPVKKWLEKRKNVDAHEQKIITAHIGVYPGLKEQKVT